MKKYSGFTLMELMITLLIVGILVAIGVPSVKHFMQGSQLIASTNELLSAFHVARSEAIKQSAPVTVCASTDGESCSDDTDWTTGWIVFLDLDDDGGKDGVVKACTASAANAGAVECLLRVHGAIDDPLLSMSGDDSNGDDIERFTFSGRGLPTVGGISRSGAISICSFDEANSVIGSRAMSMSFAGRVRITENAAVINCPASPPS